MEGFADELTRPTKRKLERHGINILSNEIKIKGTSMIEKKTMLHFLNSPFRTTGRVGFLSQKHKLS